MATITDRDGVRKLLEQGAQLVEVMPAKEYEAEHIPGAISIPLRMLGRKTVQPLDPNRPVIVYCWDYQ
ncbi:MAG TPA: rhodanese-like domain-containing protein [Methylomirabilota bacterium]|jgi:rhodanese-related sulfurtransferase|nr:rhodanese-like domain-containing protein [Methylomirabilota bacterium]